MNDGRGSSAPNRQVDTENMNRRRPQPQQDRRRRPPPSSSFYYSRNFVNGSVAGIDNAATGISNYYQSIPSSTLFSESLTQLNPLAVPFVPMSARMCSNENLRDRLVSHLERGIYECMICCASIEAHDRIWSCAMCYQIFHLGVRGGSTTNNRGNCIVEWARKSFEPDVGWRCPSCQNVTKALPNEYRCFCGKQKEPRYRQMADVHHSCGQTCQKSMGVGCPHKCTLQCHPGPCPSCPRTVELSCLCGNERKSVRCGIGEKIQCSKICDKLLNCQLHKCKQVCHAGDCSDCTETITQHCFCGTDQRTVSCTIAHRESIDNGYSCGRPCPKQYDCGAHNCEAKCHRDNCGTCPLAPERLQLCPCGKRQIDVGGRTKCTDPVPTCDGVCDKVLPCGSTVKPHRCKLRCHRGACPPCPTNNSSLRCRCGATNRTMPCIEFVTYNDNNRLLCERRCKKLKSCKLHRCLEHCCIDESHLCTQICNKLLSCTIHSCDRLCHVGQCDPCLEASFDEQFCRCGRTWREPPIACGTPPPVCNQPCSRPHSCTIHPAQHNCHNEAECPPCTFLVRRWCYGHHEHRNNIPCFLTDVSCGKPCQKPLPCGLHQCIRICHEGVCLTSAEQCKQACPIPRDAECGHPCAQPCHAQSPCPVSICNKEVDVSCPCGRKNASITCSTVEKLHLKANALAAMEDDADSNDDRCESKRILGRENSRDNLICDADCARAIRNKKLSAALGIDTDDYAPIAGSELCYTEFLKAQLKLNLALVVDIEKAFVQLVHETQTKQSSTRSHIFRPMCSEMRRVIHEYAHYFNVDTFSYDSEPQRNVVATAKKGVSIVPKLLLSSLSAKTNGSVKMKIAAPPTFTASTNHPSEKVESSSPSQPMQSLATAAVAFRRLNNL